MKIFIISRYLPAGRREFLNNFWSLALAKRKKFLENLAEIWKFLPMPAGRLAKNLFGNSPKRKKYTYTYDNGTEIGKEDELLERKINMDVHRAYPYHSWERGCNENFNKLVREAFLKGTDFAKISDEEVKEVEKLLNNRPRKRLNYYTPREVFFEKNS